MRTLTDLYLEWEEVLSVDPVDAALIASLEAEAEEQGVKLVEVADVLVARWDASGIPTFTLAVGDGRFIEIFGLIDLLNFDIIGDGDRRDYRGKVLEIKPNRHAPGKPDIRVQVHAGGPVPQEVWAKPSQIRSATKATARLDVPEETLFDVALEAPIEVDDVFRLPNLNAVRDRANTTSIEELDIRIPGSKLDGFEDALNANTRLSPEGLEWRRENRGVLAGRDMIGFVEGEDGKVLVVEEREGPVLRFSTYDRNGNPLMETTLDEHEYGIFLQETGIDETPAYNQYRDFVGDIAVNLDEVDLETYRDPERGTAKLADQAADFQISAEDLRVEIEERHGFRIGVGEEPSEADKPSPMPDLSSAKQRSVFQKLREAGFTNIEEMEQVSGDQPGEGVWRLNNPETREFAFVDSRTYMTNVGTTAKRDDVRFQSADNADWQPGAEGRMFGNHMGFDEFLDAEGVDTGVEHWAEPSPMPSEPGESKVDRAFTWSDPQEVVQVVDGIPDTERYSSFQTQMEYVTDDQRHYDLVLSATISEDPIGDGFFGEADIWAKNGDLEAGERFSGDSMNDVKAQAESWLRDQSRILESDEPSPMPTTFSTASWDRPPTNVVDAPEGETAEFVIERTATTGDVTTWFGHYNDGPLAGKTVMVAPSQSDYTLAQTNVGGPEGAALDMELFRTVKVAPDDVSMPMPTIGGYRSSEAGNVSVGDEIILPGDIPGRVTGFDTEYGGPGDLRILTDNGAWFGSMSDPVARIPAAEVDEPMPMPNIGEAVGNALYRVAEGIRRVEGRTPEDEAAFRRSLQREIAEEEDPAMQEALRVAMISDGALDALIAAVWDPDLHPRGRDGRFINVMGLIKLFDFEMPDGGRIGESRGKVLSIKPDKKDRGHPDIEVELPDGKRVTVKPEQVASGPATKATLDAPNVPEGREALPTPDVDVDALRARVHVDRGGRKPWENLRDNLTPEERDEFDHALDSPEGMYGEFDIRNDFGFEFRDDGSVLIWDGDNWTEYESREAVPRGDVDADAGFDDVDDPQNLRLGFGSDEHEAEVIRHVEEARVEGLGTKERPIRTADPLEAVKALHEDLHVELQHTDQVAVLLDEVAAVANEARELGEKAPDYDFCKLTVPGTSLFCAESKGIPRIEMPQLGGVPTPGSPADALPKDDGEVDIGPAFVDHLTRMGIDVQEIRVPASHLKASQNQLVGAKVAGMMSAMLSGNEKAIANIRESAIFVTTDGYVVDGHHRWAAVVGLDVADGTPLGDVDMPVRQIDMDIISVLQEAFTFAGEFGVPPKAGGAGAITDVGVAGALAAALRVRVHGVG